MPRGRALGSPAWRWSRLPARTLPPRGAPAPARPRRLACLVCRICGSQREVMEARLRGYTPGACPGGRVAAEQNRVTARPKWATQRRIVQAHRLLRCLTDAGETDDEQVVQDSQRGRLDHWRGRVRSRFAWVVRARRRAGSASTTRHQSSASSSCACRRYLDRLEREGMIMLQCHFPSPGYGRIVRLDGRRYWQGV